MEFEFYVKDGRFYWRFAPDENYKSVPVGLVIREMEAMERAKGKSH